VPLILLLSYMDIHLAIGLCHSQGGPLNAHYSAEKKTQNKSSGRGETTKSKEQRQRKTIKTKVQRRKVIGLYIECKRG
jgi:hypothetical protein